MEAELSDGARSAAEDIYSFTRLSKLQDIKVIVIGQE